MDGAVPADRFSLEVLEFAEVVRLLREFLSGPISAPLLASLDPRRETQEIEVELGRAREAREFLREKPRPSLGSLQDPRPILEKVSVEGASCTGLEILALLGVMRAACDLRALFLKTPFVRLVQLVSGLPDCRPLVQALEGKILPDGTVDSSASPALARIRRAIQHLREEVQSNLEKLMRRLSQDEILQDAVVTLRNERFVIPVRAVGKRRVAGVIHGASSSGATVFIEPFETVPLNNDLAELQDREVDEIQRILKEFSDKLRARATELQAATEILSELDLAFAKAEFARQYDCSFPEFHQERSLRLKDLRHPVLEKTLRTLKRRPVPLTVELGEPKTLMVISGPNAGGKTVALKSIGVAVLMAQSGLPVAASEARLPLFGRVLADIGDQQSIQANLSTFSAHIKNIQSMVQAAGRNDLVLLDEIGASTEPTEGAALAVAILDHLRGVGAMTFVTTHLARLKGYAAEAGEAINAAMEFDEATLQPTYRLLIGLPGKSSALDIASRLGLEPSIVERARAYLSPADSEGARLVATLHRQRSDLERQLARLDEFERELEARRVQLERKFEQEQRARLRELDARLEETLRRNEQSWQDSLTELRQAQTESPRAGKRHERKAASLARETREEWNARVLEILGEPAPEKGVVESPPAVGDSVRVRDFSTPGTVVARSDDGSVEVEVGRMRLRVRQEEVRVLASGKSVLAGPHAVVASSVGALGEVSSEINVIGNTAEEARERVDKFLDQAFVSGRFRLLIVHGHGKGILKRTLHDMLGSHPHVDKFYPAPSNQGGTGATIVELKL